MPPATKTELVADLPTGGDFAIMEVEDMVQATLKGLRSGAKEIRPGQAGQLYWMSRVAHRA